MENANNNILFEKAPIPMWVFDTDTLFFLAVNEAAITSYGYSRAEFLTMTINDIRPLEDIPVIADIVKQNAKTRKIYSNAFRHLKKNGVRVDVLIESNPIEYDGIKARIVVVSDITKQLNAAQSLAFSEQRFRALVQEGSDLIAIVDLDLNYKYVSPTSLRLLGMTPESFIGHSASEFIHEDDVSRVMAEAATLDTNHQVQFSPFRFKNSKGDWRWIETKATNLTADVAVGGIVCNSKDITERMAHEKLTSENVEKYQIVSKATSDIIWDYNLKTGEVSWNRGISGILKYKNIGSITDISWWKEKIHPEDRARVLLKFDKYMAGRKKRWEDEYRFLCGDGIYRYILDRAYIGFNEQEEAYRIIGAMQDISMRMEHEHWSKLLESVVINTTDGVLITDAKSDPKLSIVYVNDALVHMSGYSRSELIGKQPDIFHGKDILQKGLEQIEHAVKHSLPCNVELTNYTKQGRSYGVSINVCPVTDSTGEITHWVSIQRDITESQNYVKEIEQQNKKLIDIAWMQSHMVRSPLARIMSLTELLEEGREDKDTRLLLSYLSRSAQELDEVLENITNNMCKI